MGLIIPLAALLLLAGAGAARAAAPTARPKSRVRVARRRGVRALPARRKAKAPTRKARVRIKPVGRKPTTREKKILRRIKAVDLAPVGKRAKSLLKKLSRLAAKRKAHPKVRKAASNAVTKAVRKSPASVRALPPRGKVKIIKAVQKADKTTKVTPDQAARMLQLHTKHGGNQGTKNNRSTVVRNCQRTMGLDADGIIGPGTRRRAKELGFPLYTRKHQKR